MVELILHIILIALLVLSFYQDWKFRAISWLVFPLLSTTTFFLFLMTENGLSTLLFNIAFLVVVMGCLILYISFKRGAITNIFKTDFGFGDILFLIAITPLFVDRNYILFFITGMLLSGLIHLLIVSKKTSQKTTAWKNEKIPLAGYLALYLIGLKTVDLFIASDLFYTPIL